jgi:hypothetical protein
MSNAKKNICIGFLRVTKKNKKKIEKGVASVASVASV